MQSGRRLTDLEPAGFARRASAFAIDMVVAGVALVALLQLVLDPLRQALGPAWARVGWFYFGYGLLTVSLPLWLYFSGYESSPAGATPGKRWLGLSVTSTEGHPIRFGRALLRTILKLLPFEIAHYVVTVPGNPFLGVDGAVTIPALDALRAPVITGLLVAVLLFGAHLFAAMLHPDGRGLHDLIAHTFVVRSPSDVPAPAAAAPYGPGPT